jgi:hypothetical protein
MIFAVYGVTKCSVSRGFSLSCTHQNACIGPRIGPSFIPFYGVLPTEHNPPSPTLRHPELVRIGLPRLLYMQTVLVGDTVIIDDDSFSLGMPTPMEMLEQHALLLQGENEQLQHNLSRARKNIEKLVVINQGQAGQITQLKGKIERLTWDVSSLHVENTELKNKQLAGCSPTWGGMPPGGKALNEAGE